jgi:hypothetical protein
MRGAMPACEPHRWVFNCHGAFVSVAKPSQCLLGRRVSPGVTIRLFGLRLERFAFASPLVLASQEDLSLSEAVRCETRASALVTVGATANLFGPVQARG